MNKDNKKMAQQRKADERARAERTAKGKKLLPLFALLLVAAIIAAAGFFTWRAKKKAAEMEVDGGYLENGQYDMSNDELTSIEIKVKDYGTIKADLDATAAPITVENFVSLAKEGFYDGLTFHRIMDEFMIQGGDPNGNGTGENPISHARGAISMARSQDMDSASSQFFIVQTDSYFLDNNYAGFGYVTEGMEIVDQICKDAKPTDDNGTIPKEEQPVIESITVLD